MEQVKEIYEDDRNKKWYKGCKNNNYKEKVQRQWIKMKKKFEKIKNEEKDFKNKSKNEYEKYISFKEEYNNEMSK